MNRYILIVFILFLSGVFYTCKKDPSFSKLKKAIELSNEVQDSLVPDRRVAIYNIIFKEENGRLRLSGETNVPETITLLKQKLQAANIDFENRINLLPDSSVGDKKFAVVNNSVANIRSAGKHSAELGTQALLGMVLNVFKIDGDFYRVQTPDKYISWVDHGGVVLMNEEEIKNWEQAPKIIFTEINGFVYADENESAVVSDIVLGGQLKLLQESKKHYKVQYPDDRTGFVRKSESMPYSDWLHQLKPSGELIEKYARSLMGTPYLWGGTSTKGMDCSGFTKTVYLMNGLIIPRDASQQIYAGLDVDPDLEFKNLKKGDLMFFGKKATDSTKQRVTHVGIWLGDGLFIHESMRVRLSSIDPESKYYDKFNTERYLGSRRYLGVKDPLLLDLRTLKPEGAVKP